MSVLVTGGAGYIGSHMVWRLLDAGENVVVIDRLSTGFDWAVPAEVELVVGDIGDPELVGKVPRERGVSAVFHFAGSIVVPESVTDPLGYYLNNTVKSRALLEACVDAGVPHFIFSSTAAVYGTPETADPVAEDAALRPESPYGTSKLMTETMLRDTAAAHPLNYACLRYFNVAGADPAGRTGQSTPDATHLIKVATQAALSKRPYMQVFGTDYPTPDGTCIRDYIHVTDLVDAHYLALEHLRATGENLTANCGYGHGHSVLEVVDVVKRVSGSEFEVRMADRRAGDAVSIVANSDRIRERLGWKPHYDDLEKIVTHALNWEDALSRRNT
ncbi:UDP-glucose 4-epimerase GalE [Hoeflea poritis]|uniref:UDP-glucose 4-epimerase n=1 Tax=Hoeflea poritis TaxID=2993659 RepID=A0ABT4VTX8_9HYPH|nr:UDP-glucose 4-epimerase GalE [Hoeflea poritis]MDA4848176.1 UDP-glucose 4-epimerase GalE [Hoeflea poritis]